MTYGHWGWFGALAVTASMLPIDGAVAQQDPTSADLQKVNFHIAQQSLGSALNEFGQQSGFTIAVSSTLGREKIVSPLYGAYTPSEALQQILASTGLHARYLDEKTIAVLASSVADPSHPIKLADATRPISESDDSNKADSASESGPTSDSSNSSASNADDAGEYDASKSKHLDEVVVTGTHIQGEAPVGSSLTTYTRADIQSTGVATLDQFARQMPQNFASTDPAGLFAPNGVGFDQSGANYSNLGAGFNIHGIGPGATLTLLDGQRMSPAGSSGAFVDISLIPLAAIERIDVLADGASALYGADAIAGVVNIVTRKDYQGAETSVRSSATSDGGGGGFNVSQVLGTSWTGGNAMLVYEHDKQNGLFTDRRDVIPADYGVVALLPEEKRDSALLSVHQDFSDVTRVTGNAFFSERKFETSTQQVGLDSFQNGSPKQYGGTFGISQSIAHDWRIDFTGNGSWLKQPSVQLVPSEQLQTNLSYDTRLVLASLLANGPLFSLPAGVIKAAIGAEYRRDDLDAISTNISTGVNSGTFTQELNRHVSSVYAELLVPIMGGSNAAPWAKRLELSIASRYDRYSDVGSSTNPKVGLLWSPTGQLDLRASYGRSFHAPSLDQLVQSPVYYIASIPNPASPSGATNTLVIQGGSKPGLAPETARTLTAGFDLHLESVPGFTASATYFRINYDSRVALPPLLGGNPFALYSQAAALAPFIDYSPNQNVIDGYAHSGRPFFDITPTQVGTAGVQAVFDNQLQNIAITRESGLDGVVSYRYETQYGTLGDSLAATYLLRNDYQVAPTVPETSINNTIGEPVDLRIHNSLNWSKGSLASALTFNYWGKYKNPLYSPATEIGSWNTLDLQLSYRSSDKLSMAVLRGITVALTVQNLANKRPPAVGSPSFISIGFDPANANALGRAFVVQAIKKW